LLAEVARIEPTDRYAGISIPVSTYRDDLQLMDIYCSFIRKRGNWDRSVPLERVESLRPALRFRVFLGRDDADELEVMR
jgi:hypothetical protein